MRRRPALCSFVMVEVRTNPAAENQVFVAHLLRFKKPPQGPSAVLAAGRSFFRLTTLSGCSVQYLTKVATPKYCRHMNKMLSPQLDIHIIFFQRTLLKTTVYVGWTKCIN
jgi:hypothetical protein